MTGFCDLVPDSRLDLRSLYQLEHLPIHAPQHAGVDHCLSGWGMRGHCLLRLLLESVSSFGRMDEDGFAPYLRTRCPWRLAATVGQASGAPTQLIPRILYLCSSGGRVRPHPGHKHREEYPLTEYQGTLLAVLLRCKLWMYHLSFQPSSPLAACCYQLVWMPHEGVFLRKWLQNLHSSIVMAKNAAAHWWS